MQNSSKSSIGSSQIHQYQQQALSIRRAHESITRNTPIAFDESMTETDMRIARRSQKIIQTSRILAVDQTGMDKLILKNLRTGQQKYAQFDSGTDHSSDEELKISYNVQQIVLEANKDPQPGKITFIAKLVRSPGMEFDYLVQNIKPKGHKTILKVQQIKSFGNFALYEINTDSSHRQIAIHLKTKDKRLTSTKILAFAPRSIYISESLSYDFQIGSQLTLNPLQGFLAACILQGDRICQQIIEISGKKAFKNTILTGKYKIDEHTKALINNNKSSVSFLKMIKFLLQEEETIFSKPTRSINEISYKVLAKIYIQQILKFKANPDSNDQDISQQQIVEYFELFLHLICLQQLKSIEIKFDHEVEKLIKAKISEIIKYSFRTGEVSLYHKYTKFSINTGIFNMSVGYDTIKQYITQFSIKSPDAVQAGFQNILYHAKSNSKKMVIKMISQTFSKGVYESSNIYQKHIRDILTISSEVFNEVDSKQLTLQNFKHLYTVYYMFRSNKQLVGIARDQKFRSIIKDFILQLKDRILKGDQKQKITGLQIIQRFFMTERDDQIISQSVPLKTWIPYFFQSFYKNAKILSPLVRLWLEMIKRIDNLFGYQLIKSISISSSKTLQKLTIQEALGHINKHFKEEFLHIEKAMEVITEFVVGPLINRLLPQSQRTTYLLVNQHHREWNHGFKYHLFINEMIVEKMLRIVNKIFKDNDFDKGQAIKKMKFEINRSVDEQNDRNSLRAIVQIQLIQLSKKDVWSYFVQRREYLKTLIKILKKNDQRSQQLQRSLKDIARDLDSRKIPFRQIQKIKKMKPNEWHLFEQLTEHHEIPKQITILYQYGNNYINQMDKIKDFIREVGNKFKCPDTENKLNQIQDFLADFVTKQVITSKIEQNFELYARLSQDVLKCYRLQSFYGPKQQKYVGKTIQQIIILSNQLLEELNKYVNMVYANFQQKTLKSSNFYYFSPKKQNLKEFSSILCMNRVEIPDYIAEIVKIYDLITQSNQLFELFNGLIILQAGKFKIKEPTILKFFDYCSMFINKKDFVVSNILEHFEEAKQKLRQYKINLDDPQSKAMLELFAILINHEDIQALLKTIQPSIKDLKEKIDDIGGQITYEDLQYCQIAIQFFSEIYNKNHNQFLGLMSEIYKYIENKRKTNKNFSLKLILNRIQENSKSFKEEKENFVDNNRSTMKMINGIVKKSTFEFLNDDKNNDKVKSQIRYNDETQSKLIYDKDLTQAKEKAIILLSSAKQEDKQQKYKNLPPFIDICKNFEQLKENEQKLANWGYRQFEKKPILLTVQNSKTDEFKKKIEQRQSTLKAWKGKVKKLYDNNFKAAHLQGKKFKQFYDFIKKNQQTIIPPEFRIINEKFNIHQQIKKQIKITDHKSPQDCLQQTIKYFTKLKEKTKEEKAEDFDSQFVHFKILAKGQFDFIRGIQQIGPKRIQNLKFQHILSCTKQTVQTQLKSFIERALRDPNNEYILIGFQNLDRKKQQYLIDQITSYKRQLKDENTLKLKLCLIGDSKIDLLYKFAKDQLVEANNSSQTIKQSQAAYTQKIMQQTSNVFIVSSQRAGYGKTTFIKQHSFKHFKCTEQYYVPLSGVMNVPNDFDSQLSCQKFLWDRYTEMLRFFKQAKEKKIKACLVIQIYNIQSPSVDSVNAFLCNLAIFKQHKYRNTPLKLQGDIPIYFELENISNSVKSSKKSNKPPQFDTLLVLSQLIEKGHKDIYFEIKKFRCEDIKIEGDKKLQYSLTFLKSLKDKTINSNFIGPYPNNIIPIPIAQARQLINHYFFSKFPQDDPPSGYLWTYFCSLLFQALGSFSRSIFLGSQLKQIDIDISRKKPALHTELKLALTFRGEFLNVIIDNCHEFIQRSVKPGAEGQQSSLQQTLKHLPFLIIPNIDGQTFSFIYNDSKKVPKTIKNLIVLQDPGLINQINLRSIDDLFETVNIAKIQKSSQKQWKKRASEILMNISGNKNYSIDCQEGYVVNIDNFFKMCLITQRMRLNIPIVIMGEAGIGKTALLRHVVSHLYKHQFAVFNINAGLPLQSVKISNESSAKINCNNSLTSMIQEIKRKFDRIPKDSSNKLWVFFDQFNTLRELGFFKQVIMDKRFLGKKQSQFQNIVMMAACNPHKKLKARDEKEEYTLNKGEKLAFDVLPAPHSLIESMWNYGALNTYEYQKYISKMLVEISYRSKQLPQLILDIHKYIKDALHDSAVSLRDIDRLRQIYKWFIQNLPHLNISNIRHILGSYNNRQERALIMALYFTYLLRFDDFRRKQLQKIIQAGLSLQEGFVLAAKTTQQNDFCSRLNLKWDTPIALNNSLKQNIFTSFVCIYTRLPLLIIGTPGSSKSISLRLLHKNLSTSQNDQYLRRFKKLRQFQIQGSENSTTQDIKVVFQKAYSQLIDKQTQKPLTLAQMRDTFLIVFDQIGLAQKSPDNPLKVLHPYLQVNRQENLSTRMLSFIGISNSELDVSKMSRLLVLRRPKATIQDLQYTAVGIASGYQQQALDQRIKFLIKKMTKTFYDYLGLWRGKMNNYPLFYGLRDFYSLIKDFMSKVVERKIQRDNNDAFVECACQSIFQNFNGWQNSFYEFKQKFFENIGTKEPFSHPSTTQIVNNLKRVLDKETNRYPMIIGEDEQSLLFIKCIIEQHFKQRAIYMEGSPFEENKQYSLKIIGDIYRYIESQNILIISSLKEGVKTGLYDFFNKSFNVLDDGRRILKVKTGTQSYKMHPYNEKFNCVYLLLRKDLLNVQPPFLSRFQKYRFNLSQYRNQNCSNVFQKISTFSRRIQEICVSNNLKHYQFKDLFANVNQKALQSLAVASYLAVVNKKNQGRQMSMIRGDNVDQYYREAIKRLIMNSGQEFYFLFKYIVQKKGELAQLRNLIQQVINRKNQKQGERKFIIRFTTDEDYIKKYAKSADNHCIQFETFKKQADIIDELNTFLSHNKRKNMYIMMKVLQHSKCLNFVISQISRVLNRAQIQSKNVNQKRIRLVFLLQKNRIDAANGQSVQQIIVSHFTPYDQEYDDGKMGEIESSKEDMFKSVIRIEKILKLVHPIFQFELQNPNNIKLVQNLIKNISHQFQMSNDSLFQKHCEEIVCFLQSNFQVNQEIIKEIMSDKQAIGKQQSFKEAITRYFADKKLFGPVAVFLKYLFQKQAYFSYSSEFLHNFIESEAYNLSQEVQIQFQRAKKSQGYHQFMKDIFKVKSAFIKTEYNNVKMQRRMPNPSKKYTIKVNRPRLIPYSKVQCQTLLNFKEKELGWLAKQIYVNKQEQKNYQAYNSYADELKKKTSFKNPKYNFYSKYFDEDKNLKTMLFFDLLADFVSLKGLPTKFVPQFYQTMHPIIYMQDNNPKFAKIVGILLGFQDIWVEIFKIVMTFYQQDSELELKFRPKNKNLSLEVMKQYCKEIIQQIIKCLLAPDCLQTRFNADKFCRVLINSLFHIEKLEKKLQLHISRNIGKIKSIRTALVFLQLYDSSKKVENVQHFINKIAQNPTLNYYSIALDIFDTLKEQAKPQQIKLINQFQANSLFLEWLKQKDPTKKNLIQFIKKCCRDENFAHNSVATLNHFVQVLKPNYKDIMGCFKKLNNKNESNGQVVEQLLHIGEDSRKNNFKDNLSIVIINMFMQKIVAAFEKGDILLQKAKEFEDIVTKLSTDQLIGFSKHFSFAFIKIFLENYIDKFIKDDRKYQRTFQLIDNILSNETSIYSSNFRFFCAKLLRTKMPVKQIKIEYMSKKKCKWITLIQKKLDVFFENQSRSIIVPKDTVNTSQNLKVAIKKTMQIDGKPDHFDQLFAAGCNSPYNRYSLFNFFLRFYFSMLYNHINYKTLVISKLQKQKARYEQSLGQNQFQLIWRYANNKFDENVFVQAPQQFSQDKIIFFNNFNWLLAIKQASSPLNSLFFENGGKLHKNFTNVFQNQFFPCGPENPFINIAQTVYELTRNNDIGVYLCSSKCDVLYCHLNCGWPNETLKCPICGEAIGLQPGGYHTVVKQQQGAKRVMSPKLKDSGGNFYMGSLGKVPYFFDAQRCYIQAQINRMKEKSEVTASGKQVKLKGYQVQNQGRVSSLTFYIVRQILNSLFYCLTSMKLISPQQASKIFKVKDYQQAKNYIFGKHTEDINYIKKALGLDNKIYGWIYGVHAFVYEVSLNFRSKFNQYVIQTQNRSKQLIQNIQTGITQKTIKDVYIQMFKDIMDSLRNGLITKQLQTISTFTAQNRFTRDTFETILERFIKKVTSQQKFRLAEQSFALQGCMQFPNDIYLTEDKIDEEKFQFSKLLKLPDRIIKYNQIIVSFQLLIRQQYPFLDYILKNSDQINSMTDFSNILLFSNYLRAQITNTFERIDAEKPIGLFIEELKKQKSNQMSHILRHPEIVVASWNKLAKRLGQLQYKCTPMGKMNDQFSLQQTPVKAFLIEGTKKNPFGMALSVIFCNFAEMHNDIVNILNTKKNQIPQYKCLNLLDQTLTLNTQNLKQSDVYSITEKQLQEKLYEFSISSITYGRNFVFTNFQSYQHYFIMKLAGKGLFNSNIEELKSICYNGEAFAKTSEYSNTLAQIKGYFDTPLTESQRKFVRQTLRNKNHIKQIQECAIKVRGDLEKMMIIIKKCNGIIDATDITDFRNKYELNFSVVQTSQFGQIEVAKIVSLYEFLELQMKPSVLQKLHEDYKFKLQLEEQQPLRELIEMLPTAQNDECVTLCEFGHAVYRFIARNLQGNMLENDVNLLAFLPEREDFWPNGFDVYTKLQLLTQHPVLAKLTLKHICALFSILQNLIQKKVGQSKI